MTVTGIVQNNRQPYFDFLRGIGALMVVSLHLYGYMYNCSNLSLFFIFIREIYQAAVPIFCVSSAYFLINKNIETKEMYFKFLKRQVMKVFLPMLFFSIPYFLIDIRNGGLLYKSIIELVTGSYSIYYFVPLIIQFYVLLPLFQKSKVIRNPILGIFVSVFWSFIYVYLIRRECGALPLIVYGAPIYVEYASFTIGSSVRRDEIRIRFWLIVILSIIFLILSILESYYLIKSENSMTGLGVKPTSVIFCSLFTLLLYHKNMSEKYKRSRFSFIFEMIGKKTSWIY